MAALRKEVPTKSFFSSPSHTFKKLVSAFPRTQTSNQYSTAQLRPGDIHKQQQHQPKLVLDCWDEVNGEDEEDEIDEADIDGNAGYEVESAHIPTRSAAEEDGVGVASGVDEETEYSSSSSEGNYSRPRIRKDLLPHDFSAWQKSPSIASSTSRDAETFSEVLSSSTSQDRYGAQGGSASDSRANGQREHHLNPKCMKSRKSPSPSNQCRNSSPTQSLVMASSPVVDLHLQEVRLKLPDLKLEVATHGISGACKYGAPSGFKSLPEDCWSIHSGASEDGRRNSVDGSCWQRRKVLDPVMAGTQVREIMQEGGTIYENLVDMMPFIETFREHQEDVHHQNNFQHHASMVYTRAPSREALAKKVAESVNARRVSRNSRRTKKKNDALWEEQENQPRRAKGHDFSCSPRRVSYENAVDIAKLQGQVEELQRKLSVTECVLQSYHCLSEPKDESSEMQLLVRKFDELQSKVAEKDHLLESAQETLAQRENEIQIMQRQLRDTEETCAGLRLSCANSEEEMNTLRCEVAALRWQMEIDAERERTETRSPDDKETQDYAVTGKQGEECEIGKMETARKMYLAALIVARLVPREECLALARILRAQLQCLVRMPSVSLP